MLSTFNDSSSVNNYISIGSKEYMNRLSTVYLPKDLAKIKTAYEFSKYGHRGVPRDDGTRYFAHPKTVAWIIFDELEIIHWRVMAAALLHDIVEDSYLLTLENIERQFGQKVANDILHLSHSHIKSVTGEDRQKRMDIYYGRLAKHGSWRAIIVKLADRIHNLRTCEVYREKEDGSEKVGRMIDETLHYYPSLQTTLSKTVPVVFKTAASQANQLLSEAIAVANEVAKM